MRVLVALDKFKDALSAQKACETVRDALRSDSQRYEFDLCPLTDGGEGFADILMTSMHAEKITANVTGPRGDAVEASIGLVDLDAIPSEARALLQLPSACMGESGRSRLAIIEMASASGLALLPPQRRDPWEASSVGTGQLIRRAHDAGACAILLGIGGSATNELGTGALTELGLRFVDNAGNIVSPLAPAQWPRVVSVQGSFDHTLLIRIACDVTNPLTGPIGATAVYGPQKGLRPDDLPRMENEVCRIAALLQQHCSPANDFAHMPGAGAAGGIAFGLATACGGRLVSGFDLLCAWCNLEKRLQAADMVITGEGRFDATSLQGKGPGAIAMRARDLGKPVHVFAGRSTAPSIPGITPHEITPADLPLTQALQMTRENLATAVRKAFGGAE